MNPIDVSLIPPHFVTEEDARFSVKGRLWQSAPSACRTRGGRLFCVYSGDNHSAGETTDNYTVCAYSDDNGDSFKLAFYAYHDERVRMSETLIFSAPDGTLYHFWTQNAGYFDGRGGIWCAYCEKPDAEKPIFSEPRRICDGCMADNPVILRDGRWLFPSSVWTHIKKDVHPLPDYEKVSVFASAGGIDGITYLGGVVDDTPSFSENTVYEKKDGTLRMLFRTDPKSGGIKFADSVDGGRTWSDAEPFVLEGPSARFMAAVLPSGNLLLVTHYNFEGRNNLTALLSEDEGESFPYALLLDERKDVSYPSGNVDADGRVTLAYDREREHAREIMLASFTEEDIRRGSFGDGSYTKKIVAKGGARGI